MLYNQVKDMTNVECKLVHAMFECTVAKFEDPDTDDWTLSVHPLFPEKLGKVTVVTTRRFDHYGVMKQQDGAEFQGNHATDSEWTYHAIVLVVKRKAIPPTTETLDQSTSESQGASSEAC